MRKKYLKELKVLQDILEKFNDFKRQGAIAPPIIYEDFFSLYNKLINKTRKKYFHYLDKEEFFTDFNWIINNRIKKLKILLNI